MTNENSIHSLKEHVLDGMTSYMLDEVGKPDPDCGYSPVEVQRCRTILDDFQSSLSGSISADDVESKVRDAVLALNKLNEDTDHCIIETDQREGLCEFLQAAATQAGLSCDEELTDEWREW